MKEKKNTYSKKLSIFISRDWKKKEYILAWKNLALPWSELWFDYNAAQITGIHRFLCGVRGCSGATYRCGTCSIFDRSTFFPTVDYFQIGYCWLFSIKSVPRKVMENLRNKYYESPSSYKSWSRLYNVRIFLEGHKNLAHLPLIIWRYSHLSNKHAVANNVQVGKISKMK